MTSTTAAAWGCGAFGAVGGLASMVAEETPWSAAGGVTAGVACIVMTTLFLKVIARMQAANTAAQTRVTDALQAANASNNEAQAKQREDSIAALTRLEEMFRDCMRQVSKDFLAGVSEILAELRRQPPRRNGGR